METIETRDPAEARRCRRAQYSGMPLAMPLDGSVLVGLVKAVREDAGPRWIVSIVPTTPKPNETAPARRRTYYAG